MNDFKAKLLLFLSVFAAFNFSSQAQTCSSCSGGAVLGGQRINSALSFHFSLGKAAYGQSAGRLYLSSALPSTNIYSPAGLFYSANRTDVSVITNGLGLRQINAPQCLADIVFINTNSYQINFYYPSQVGSLSGGLFTVTGSPYAVWSITNPVPSELLQVVISETTAAEGLIKQFTYTFSPTDEAWSFTDLAGLQKTRSVTSNDPTGFVLTESIKEATGALVQSKSITYTNLPWGTVPVKEALGSASVPEITTYSYFYSPNYGSGSPLPLQSVTRSDGSWQLYNNESGPNKTEVQSSYADVSLGSEAKHTFLYYSADYVSGSGDLVTISTNTPRCVVANGFGAEISRSYTVFPSLDKRIDIQCTATGVNWNDAGNLFTTNTFFTNGPNQYLLSSVVNPDLTLVTYDYITNGSFKTNITASGVPDSTFSQVVDGTSNYTVVNLYGYKVAQVSVDIKSGLITLQDNFGNFDAFGRPQQVTHLDGTTEYTQYACCGLDSTTDRDGVVTQYFYDSSRRQTAYFHNGILYTNVLDAAGHILKSLRIGSDTSQIVMNQSVYDLAGEVIATTNALGFPTLYGRTNDATTGGLIRTTTNADGGVISNYYFLDGTTKLSFGTATHPQEMAWNANYGYTYDTRYKIDLAGNSNEWVTSYSDMLGRNLKVVYASGSGSPTIYWYYNLLGQLTNQIDPDGVSTLYGYNSKGERCYSVQDLNADHNIDWSGSDRITFTTNDVVTDNGVNVRRTRTYVWSGSSNTSNLVSTSESSVDGLQTWNIAWNNGAGVTNSSHIGYASGGFRYVTNTQPDGTYTLNTYQYGWLQSSLTINPTMGTLKSTSYAYDPHGRRYASTDGRNGTTTYTFNNADQVTSATTPAPGTGQSSEVSYTYYDSMLRPWKTTQPDGTSNTNLYTLTGDLHQMAGSRTYPVAYGYDAQGRMTKMTNWSSFASLTGARVTTWNYDLYRGFLTSKTYADGQGPSYDYTLAGRLQHRYWARGTNTTYQYDGAGNVTNINYNDGFTPSVTNWFDRRGNLTQVLSGSGLAAMTYNDQNQVLTESYTGGPLDGVSVTNGYDSLLRRTNLTTLSGGGILARTLYLYDAASRLATLSDTTNTAGYSYLANSPLISQIGFTNGGALRMMTSKNYDYLNRLTGIASADASGNPLDTHHYAYNNANQRTALTNGDGSYWNYGYDTLGQVTSGVKHWNDRSVVAGEQFGYQFDDIGNRTSTTAGGDQWGTHLRSASYTANNLNQYTSRTVPGAVDIIGSATNTATVTVNDQATYRKGNFYRAQLPLNNTLNAVYASVTNLAVLNQGTSADIVTNVTGNIFVPQTPETYNYDADGNLLSDGRWNYSWDAENRLVNMTSLTSNPANSQRSINFQYDAKGRRIAKGVSAWNGASYTLQSSNHFLYDGWNFSVQTDNNNVATETFLWGTDLSGSAQGAGGVGGLLAISTSTNAVFASYDGNGNVTGLVSTNGTLNSQYEYGPFGEVIRATGPMAKANPFRFSTKYQDDETDLLYYGYRYYNPSMGRWLIRDLLDEHSFRYNIISAMISKWHGNGTAVDDSDVWWTSRGMEDSSYLFVNNASIGNVDFNGLASYDICFLRSSKCASYKTIRLNPFWDLAVCIRRNCNFRCYCYENKNCTHIPCTDKSCPLDHGVEEAWTATVGTGIYGGVLPADCKLGLPVVYARGNCNGTK